MTNNSKKLTGIFSIVQSNIELTLKSILNHMNFTIPIKNNIDKIYISEKNYIIDMKNIVEPYINSKLEYGYIDESEDIKLYYEKYKVRNAQASIVICHGYKENLEKYHEMIYYFMKNNYSVFAIEHRGHGRSGSLGIKDKTQINVNDFNEYVLDLKKFMDQIVIPNSKNKKIFLFAHSMGGAIGTKFLEDYTDYFEKAILNAPMFEVNTGNIPPVLANIIVKSTVSIGKGGNYVLGKAPYRPNPVKESTSITNREKYVEEIILNNEEFQRGGASYNWTNEAFKVTKEIVKQNKVSSIEIPVLLFQAGEDTYVKPDGQNKFAQWAKNCEIKQIENSKHCIYLEKDEIQKPYIKEILNFYTKL